MNAPNRENQIHILDTSVLYPICVRKHALPHAGRSHVKADAKTAEAILSKEQVVIPHTVLMEILGQLLHTRIFRPHQQDNNQFHDTQYNYQDYVAWYRTRHFVAEQFAVAIINPMVNVSIWQRVPDNDEIAFSYDMLSEGLIQDLMKYYANRYKKRGVTVRDREPKCLDGMDGAIVYAAISIARENPSKRCILVTEDSVWAAIVKDVRRKSCVANSKMPGNLFVKNLRDYGKN